MTGLAMLRIVAIVFISVLTIRGEVYAQEEFAVFEDSLYHRLPDVPRPLPSYPQGVHVDAHEGDSLVLVELYRNTEGNAWVTKTGWLQTPVSEWYGITLDSDGRVKEVNLQSNKLVGQLPASISKLAELDSLSLPDNELTGPIPPELGQLKELKYLWLSWNDLSGKIPVELAQMTKMEELAFTDNSLTGQIPRELGQLANLKRLWLSDNALSGTIPSELRHLEMIGLNGNNLSGPIPTHLAEWENLIELYLCKNGFTGQIPPQLGQLSKLVWLCLGGNQLSGPIPTELSQLTSLKILRLYGNRLSGSIPQELGQLSRLEELHLYGNRLSGSIPQELGQLSRLRELLLSGNQLSGSIPQVLGQLSQLQWLILDGNQLSGSIPQVLGQLSQLLRLGLAINQLSGTIPTELGQLSQLQWLHLHNNRLSGTVPQELGQLGNLWAVALHRNQFRGPLPDWTRLSRLESVRLAANQFLFADLLPNADLSRRNQFTYAPQDTIITQLTCSTAEYVFTTPATAQGNEYQWYRNGQPIPGEVSDTLRLTTASELDDYHAKITNNRLPELTLVSRKVSTGGASGCTTQQYANVADSTLLVDFYNRTHGSLLWHNHTGWLEEPVVQWYGITLDASGRVTDINLPNNNLVGQLPLSQLDQLAHLRYLNVSGNEFSGTIPEEFGALTQLEYLVLGHNKLAGNIPRELADQAPLKVLNISGNQLAGEIPTELNQITTLQTFSVSANQLSGPVPDFTGLDQLDSLHVAQNEFLFMDLLPNASLTRLDDFVYAPQDSIDTFLSRTASGFAFTTAAKAMGNRYQWYRDDQPISGPQSDTLHVSANSDPAQYHATVTNDRLPALTLVSRKKGVHDGVTMTEAEFTEDFLLHQSYPNPFAEATTVAFELATPEHVRIVVYDLLGQVVATIADGRFAAGVHRIEFAGDHLASGQYLYRMEAGAYRATRSMSVVR